MSIATYSLLCCRKTGTSGTALRHVSKWKYIRKIAKITGPLILGGSLFITYEIQSLMTSITLDTQALQQEKLRSYIYMNTFPLDEKNPPGITSKVRKQLHKSARKVIEASASLFGKNTDAELYDKSNVEDQDFLVWLLLKKTQSTDKLSRLEAVENLTKIHNWQDYQYRTVAQACDARTVIGLARCKDMDLRFFLPTPTWHQGKNGFSTEEKLNQLLSSLPQTELDHCIKYLTSLVLRESSQALAAQRRGLCCFGGNGLPYAESLSTVPSEKCEVFSLRALLNHSKISNHVHKIVSNGGLQLLQRLYLQRSDSPKIQRSILRIIGNLALYEDLHSDIVNSGWISILAEAMKSPYVIQSSHAARALANLDRETVIEKYPDDIYILHPQHRSSQPIEADVVFVHGLLGAAFKTWRQQDLDQSLDDSNAQEEDEDYTQCWPKDWLASDFPALRIISVEYETHLSDWTVNCPGNSHRKSLDYRSTVLLSKLKTAGVGDRPIIWVTHSMGGLLVKKMLVNAYNDADLHNITENTRGIAFFSVPHQGSQLAEYSMNARLLLFPSVEVKELSKDSLILKELHEEFLKFAKNMDIRVVSFAEKLPTWIGSMMKMHVVPLESSDVGIGDLVPVEGNHLNVCKPKSKGSIIYQRTLQLIYDSLGKDIATHKTV